jgi:hypothetical protein
MGCGVWVPGQARDDVVEIPCSIIACFRDLAAHSARVFLFISRPLQQRAQGRPGARCTRGLACIVHREHAHEHTGSAENIRPSLRNGFTAYIVLSLVRRALLPPSPARSFGSHELDASVGRRNHTTSPSAKTALVSRSFRVHRISTHVRDDRERPSCRVRRAEKHH